MAHRDLLHATAGHAADFLDSLAERPIFPRTTPEELRAVLGGPLPDDAAGQEKVVHLHWGHATYTGSKMGPDVGDRVRCTWRPGGPVVEPA